MPRLKKGILIPKKNLNNTPTNIVTYSCHKILIIFAIQVHIIFNS